MTSWDTLLPPYSLCPQWRHPCLVKASVSAAMPALRPHSQPFSLEPLSAQSLDVSHCCVPVSVSWRWNCSHWILHRDKGACCFTVPSYCTPHSGSKANDPTAPGSSCWGYEPCCRKTYFSWEHGMSSNNKVFELRVRIMDSIHVSCSCVWTDRRA